MPSEGKKKRPNYLNELIRSSTAVSSALEIASCYKDKLGIKAYELSRYRTKTRNLALCYQGFGNSFSAEEARRAGRAAFLSCAYDVATDWRKEDPPEKWRAIFEDIVRAESSPELANIAMELYDKDTAETLSHDGLERGSLAFRFVIGMMGVTEEFQSKANVDDVGLMLQIVDDVLDYESDVEADDLNCIKSPRAREYLSYLIAITDAQIRFLFPNSGILFYTVKKARSKATQILNSLEGK